jgi:hypothetical protein
MQRTESDHVYLNVDLEVRSRHDLTPLAAALQSRLEVLHAGRAPGSGFLASFEVPGLSLSPDVAITRLASALVALPRSARRLWRLANDRVFDIGLDAAAVTGSYPLTLREETVRTIARLNARVAVTLYSLPKARRKRRTTG